jgi:hypothetical protein
VKIGDSSLGKHAGKGLFAFNKSKKSGAVIFRRGEYIAPYLGEDLTKKQLKVNFLFFFLNYKRIVQRVWFPFKMDNIQTDKVTTDNISLDKITNIVMTAYVQHQSNEENDYWDSYFVELDASENWNACDDVNKMWKSILPHSTFQTNLPISLQVFLFS